MRELTNKQKEFARKEFSAIEAFVLENGGKRRDTQRAHEFELPTTCGLLSISLDIGCYIFSINCRFADLQKARVHFKADPHSPSFDRLNPFSGKWNFVGTDAVDLVTAFLSETKPLLGECQRPI